MNSYSGQYLSGQTRLPHYPHCLSLFTQLKSSTCLLTQLGMNLKVLETAKMGRKIILEREKMKIVIRYSHNARKVAFLRKGIMTLGDCAQPW